MRFGEALIRSLIGARGAAQKYASQSQPINQTIKPGLRGPFKSNPPRSQSCTFQINWFSPQNSQPPNQPTPPPASPTARRHGGGGGGDTSVSLHFPTIATYLCVSVRFGIGLHRSRSAECRGGTWDGAAEEENGESKSPLGRKLRPLGSAPPLSSPQSLTGL